jgi:hypothetical protein
MHFEVGYAKGAPEHGHAPDHARHFVAVAFKPDRSRTGPGPQANMTPALPIGFRKRRAASLIRIDQTQ